MWVDGVLVILVIRDNGLIAGKNMDVMDLKIKRDVKATLHVLGNKINGVKRKG